MLLTKPFLQQVWLSRSMIPAAQEAEKGESKVCDPSGLHSEFRASLGNLGSHCLKKDRPRASQLSDSVWVACEALGSNPTAEK